jgi:hypothetical protein
LRKKKMNLLCQQCQVVEWVTWVVWAECINKTHNYLEMPVL